MRRFIIIAYSIAKTAAARKPKMAAAISAARYEILTYSHKSTWRQTVIVMQVIVVEIATPPELIPGDSSNFYIVLRLNTNFLK